MTTPFARCLAAIATPFGDDLSVDVPALATFCRHLLSNGCDGLVLFGTTGEATSLSVAERKDTLDQLVDQGIDPARLLVGTGCAALTDTIELTAHATSYSVAGVLVLPPFYYTPATEDGIVSYYERVIMEVPQKDLRLYLYHIPQMSGVPLTAEIVGRLVKKFPAIIKGYKDSSGDWENTKGLLAQYPSLHIYVGSEVLLLENLRAGGAGCISATANVNAAAINNLIQKAETPEAKDLQERVSERRKVVQAYPTIPAVKALIAKEMGHPAWQMPRVPLLPLSAKDADALKQGFDALDM